MKTINIFNYEWKSGTSWGGIYHPDSMESWYDEDAIKIKDENLILSTYKKSYTTKEGIKIPVAVGRLYSVEKFHLGTFEAEIKLPSGKHLFPAFWLSGWLPEIDIMEAFTNDKNHYFKWDWKHLFRFWAVETNVHWDSSINAFAPAIHSQLGGKRAWFGFKNPRKRFIKYKLIWTKDSIDIWYNNKKVLSQSTYEKPFDKSMHVIFNNGVDKNVDINNPPNSEMVIRNFKYTKP